MNHRGDVTDESEGSVANADIRRGLFARILLEEVPLSLSAGYRAGTSHMRDL